MEDRWAECRRLEGEIAARIVERGRLELRLWRWRRYAQLGRELEDLFADLNAAIEKAAAQSPRSSRNDVFRSALGIWYGSH